MKKILIIIAIIIVLIIIGIVVMSITPPPPPVQPTNNSAPVEVTPASELIDVKSVPSNTFLTRININATRPQITNLPDFSKQELINNKISQSIDPYINEILEVSKGTIASSSNDIIVDSKIYNYTVNFERYNNDKYLSLVVNQNININVVDEDYGGIRSNIWKDTYVINCETSDEVQFKDLKEICDFANFREVIRDEINNQAKDRNIELLGNQGLMSIPDTQKFFIKDGKLYIYFERASLAPYLAGELIFEMPFNYVNGKFVR